MFLLFKIKLFILRIILNKYYYSSFLFSQIIKNCNNEDKLGYILKIEYYDKKRFDYLILNNIIEKDMSFFIKSILKSKYSKFFFPDKLVLSNYDLKNLYDVIYSSKKYENIIAFLEYYNFKCSDKSSIKKYLYKLDNCTNNEKKYMANYFSNVFYKKEVLSAFQSLNTDFFRFINNIYLKNKLSMF
jgi:hypothetical protein